MMNAETMRRALTLEEHAKKLKNQHDTYVLLKRRTGFTQLENINVGSQKEFKTGEFHSLTVEIPEEARRHVFNLWKRDVRLKYNAIVRELNQIGMKTDLRLIAGDTQC